MTREYWANLILCGFLTVLVIFAVSRMGSVLTPKGLFIGTPEPSKEVAPLLKDITLTQFSFVQGEDHEVTADFYVRNNSSATVKNLNIMCEFYDENGSYLKREKWILYHSFPGGREVKFTSVSQRFIKVEGPVECQITDLQTAEEPFFKLHRPAAGGHGAEQSGAKGHQESHGSSH